VNILKIIIQASRFLNAFETTNFVLLTLIRALVIWVFSEITGCCVPRRLRMTSRILSALNRIPACWIHKMCCFGCPTGALHLVVDAVSAYETIFRSIQITMTKYRWPATTRTVKGNIQQ